MNSTLRKTTIATALQRFGDDDLAENTRSLLETPRLPKRQNDSL